MEFKVGIYEDIPYEEYASVPAFRSHDLTSVIKCPFSWKNKKDMVQTPALLEGRVQHTVFLEHHKFDEEFVQKHNTKAVHSYSMSEDWHRYTKFYK